MFDLNWAQLGLVVSSILVVVFSFFSTRLQDLETKSFNSKLENSTKEIKELNSITNTLLKTNNELTNKTISLSKKNLDLSKELKYVIKKPDIRLESGKVTDTQYEINFKNFGSTTAENIEFKWNSSYYDSPIIKKINELAPNKTEKVLFDVFPFQQVPDLKNHYSEKLQQLKQGKIAFIVRISISYKFNNETLEYPDAYTFIFDGKEFISI